jgi:hypothetical protein
MNRNTAAPVPTSDRHILTNLLACLSLLLCWSTAMLAQDTGGAAKPAAASVIHVSHVLGFEGIANNAQGKLSTQDSALQFQNGDGTATAHISIGSIQDIILGEQDKEIGGTPMMLGKAAVPYAGGRVISLFAHKKYDIVTLEYVDSNGGFHGAIFQLNKGRGQTLMDQLVAQGAHVKPLPPTAPPAATEVKNESK